MFIVRPILKKISFLPSSTAGFMLVCKTTLFFNNFRAYIKICSTFTTVFRFMFNYKQFLTVKFIANIFALFQFLVSQ